MALLEFRKRGCQYAVLECGIGGKLDATNIIEKPICSAITTIGLDHMEVIGNSVEEISAEKSGVIKNGIPCVIGPTCAQMKPIHERAQSMNSNLIQIEDHETYDEANNSMVAEIMQVVCKNERVAFDWDTMVSLARSVSQPCRFEKIIGTKFNIIMDVCHNLQGV